jgi:ribose transport system substrate-binding protein
MSNPTLDHSSQARKCILALILGIRSPFYRTIQRGAQEEAEAQGIELLVDAPSDFSATLQAPLVDAALARKVDAILICPCDNQALIAPLLRAHDAGIPVITIDSFIGDGDYGHGPATFPLAYIGSDNIQGGKLAALSLIKAIGGSGKVYIQSTQPGLSATDEREEGFKEVVEATHGDVTLVGTGYDEGSISTAARQTAALLEQTPDLAGIFGTGDYSTKGVMQAVQKAGKSGIIKIARFDSSEEAIADLHAGSIDLVIGQLPREMGRVAVDYAIKALSSGTHNLPKQVATELIVIDRNNVDTPQAQAAIYRFE